MQQLDYGRVTWLQDVYNLKKIEVQLLSPSLPLPLSPSLWFKAQDEKSEPSSRRELKMIRFPHPVRRFGSVPLLIGDIADAEPPLKSSSSTCARRCPTFLSDPGGVPWCPFLTRESTPPTEKTQTHMQRYNYTTCVYSMNNSRLCTSMVYSVSGAGRLFLFFPTRTSSSQQQPYWYEVILRIILNEYMYIFVFFSEDENLLTCRFTPKTRCQERDRS